MTNEKRTQKALVDLLVKRVDRFLAKNPDYHIDADFFEYLGNKSRCLLGAAFPTVSSIYYLDNIAPLLGLTPLQVGSIEAAFCGNRYMFTPNSIYIDWSDRGNIDEHYYSVGQKALKRLQKKYGVNKVYNKHTIRN